MHFMHIMIMNTQHRNGNDFVENDVRRNSKYLLILYSIAVSRMDSSSDIRSPIRTRLRQYST